MLHTSKDGSPRPGRATLLRWVHRRTIDFLAAWLHEKLGRVQFGLCHGTRGGHGQKWFSEALGAYVLGTEISSTATRFPRTIQWDFHEVRPEWRNDVDFIYSNSYDHSYDPEKCFSAWASCLRPGGVMLLEHSQQNTDQAVTELDPFGADVGELVAMLDRIGGTAFGVREVIESFPFEPASHLRDLRIIVVEKRQPTEAPAG